MSLLGLAASGPKVLFGLCSLEASPLESAVGLGGPGGSRGPESESPADREESAVGPCGGAAPVDAKETEMVTAAGAVERGRLLIALVVCGGLCVVMGEGEPADVKVEEAEVWCWSEANGV